MRQYPRPLQNVLADFLSWVFFLGVAIPPGNCNGPLTFHGRSQLSIWIMEPLPLPLVSMQQFRRCSRLFPLQTI